MKFDIITIFPKIFDSYFNESIIKRARAKKLLDIRIHDLRRFSRERHGKVDDKPYGGGPGMVMKVEPLARALGSILGIKKQTLIVLLSASGKQFNAKIASDWAKKFKRIVLIAGHYEGIDERIKSIIHNSKFPIQEISVGPYVLTGGELPAMIVVDAVSRHIPGVLGKTESLEEKRYGIGVPVYTRPEVFEYKSRKYRVPKVLLSGVHKKIDEWRMDRRRVK
ncbi:MAG: tRNA (guanosine(37)-N1)-methyltransferase TrmD [Parcubacteria group bacterium]|nr:tRNA (guanosine(37)-N1)-methyltransferase TrmD [Parcubacteria group bacterium]